jgi:Raf kinase inhibitor-like YbhB/YbcL family protein
MYGFLMAAAVAVSVATGGMRLSSEDFSNGGVIPQIMVAEECGGSNQTPQLSWSGVPSGTRSFALLLHDPNAPVSGGFYHWVVYNLPGSSRSLKSDPGLPAAELGETSTGRPGYWGPCVPPNATHHYVLTLYALDLVRIPARVPLTAAQLLARIQGHVLAHASLTGTASSR